MPPGFSYFDFLRPNDPGHGGIVIFFRSNLYCKRISLPTLMHFEALAVKLIVNNCDCVIVTIYRPGSAQLNRHFLCRVNSHFRKHFSFDFKHHTNRRF